MKNLTTGFIKKKQKTFLSLVFNQPRWHGNSTHPSQNARINTSLTSTLAKKGGQSINSLKVIHDDAKDRKRKCCL